LKKKGKKSSKNSTHLIKNWANLESALDMNCKQSQGNLLLPSKKHKEDGEDDTTVTTHMNGPGKTIVTVSGMDELDSFKTIHTIK
jgi:hypothetical protein